MAIPTALLQSSITNYDKICEFLEDIRNPNNGKSLKKNIKLREIKKLFNDSWENITTKNGHSKFKHKVTEIIAGYQDHEAIVAPHILKNIVDVLEEHVEQFDQVKAEYENPKHLHD